MKTYVTKNDLETAQKFKTLVQESILEISKTENNTPKVIDLLTTIKNKFKLVNNNMIFDGLRDLNLIILEKDIEALIGNSNIHIATNYLAIRIQLLSIEETINEFAD